MQQNDTQGPQLVGRGHGNSWDLVLNLAKNITLATQMCEPCMLACSTGTRHLLGMGSCAKAPHSVDSQVGPVSILALLAFLAQLYPPKPCM